MLRSPHTLSTGVTQPAPTTTTTAAIKSSGVVWQGEEMTSPDGEGWGLPGLCAVAKWSVPRQYGAGDTRKKWVWWTKCRDAGHFQSFCLPLYSFLKLLSVQNAVMLDIFNHFVYLFTPFSNCCQYKMPWCWTFSIILFTSLLLSQTAVSTKCRDAGHFQSFCLPLYSFLKLLSVQNDPCDSLEVLLQNIKTLKKFILISNNISTKQYSQLIQLDFQITQSTAL